MQGVKKTAIGSFQKVIFESVIDTFAGGVTLDLDGYTNPDNIVPGGTLIGRKDPVTGLAKIVTIEDGAAPEDPKNLSEKPLGYLRTDIPVDDNPLAAVVIEGVVRRQALPEDYQENIDLIDAALPKMTSV